MNSNVLLLGPGPCNPSQRVLESLGAPTLGHMDGEFLELVEEVKSGLRSLFKTENSVTFPISGTGSSGMEFLLVNFLEPGDKFVVGVNGVFGGRAANLAKRLGAEVFEVSQEWGRAIDNQEFIEVVKREQPKLAMVVNGETSTGVYQPMDGIGEAVHEAGGLLMIDCVTSLAGMPVEIDAWGVDVAFSGTQKCLSVPPGLSPVTISDRAVEVFRNRKNPVPSFYFDLEQLLMYVDGTGGRSYHHTPPINMIYGLHTSLTEILEEGLENRWQRHADAANYLIKELESFGFSPFVPENERLNPLTTLSLPEGLDEAGMRGRIRNEHMIEVGAGLGPMAGKIWRIGLMGNNAAPSSVDQLVEALKATLG
ncbi:alanine--glyoxylate aminotransferase family protein [Opitutia bacterium ISCC 51]|nr:alanine--glyoxylate aminotransferase family protein [Opitutae bacterium ISCC 51]QXD28998.1 alanine--glyoxylate aminotransferase family protein [Opitutae bacterium ISCC 52]